MPGCPSRRRLGSIAGDLHLYSHGHREPRPGAEHRAGETRRSRGFRRRSAHFQFRRRFLRFRNGAARFRQFAGIRGRVSHQQLLAERVAGGARRRIDGARLLVHHGARSPGIAGPRGSRPDGRRARAAAIAPRQSGNPEGAGGVRAAHGAVAAGQHLRRGAWHVDLPPGVLSGRETRREGGGRAGDGYRTTPPSPAVSARLRSTTKACLRAARR